ncbi:MAG TPA: 50S ribosomal protein L11 methyltransferase [Gemmatimonadaceae bacterium]|nr:50S ribosomal protein L11 methyltransferase [Gemmatimonadaceae bacterium]
MNWLSVRVRPGAAERDAVIAALFGAGSQGIQEDGDAIVTHFPPGTDPERIRLAVADASPAIAPEIGETPAVDWAEEWKRGLSARRVGGLTITPPWDSGDDPATTIVIDPGMAFGTGEHPTTRLVTLLMQGVVRVGDRVADLGAGSGVLAIAAAKLGAGRVTAIEMDPDAIGNAEENVTRNGVGSVVHVIEGDAAVLLPLVAPVRVILANIISSVITALLPAMAAALSPGGRAIVSGVLVAERDAMREVLAGTGWTVRDEMAEDIWWAAVVARG